MADVIKKRTIFYDSTGGIIRFMDWASVVTPIGQMVEPFEANSRHAVETPVGQFDATDEMSRIDKMQDIRASSLNHLLTGVSTSEMAVHGGVTMPRDGI